MKGHSLPVENDELAFCDSFCDFQAIPRDRCLRSRQVLPKAMKPPPTHAPLFYSHSIQWFQYLLSPNLSKFNLLISNLIFDTQPSPNLNSYQATGVTEDVNFNNYYTDMSWLWLEVLDILRTSTI